MGLRNRVRYGGVGAYRERKVSVILEQDCHSASKVGQFQRLDIVSVNEYATLRGVVNPSSKLENGAFSRSI